jgi:rubrerythrin
MAIGYQQDSGPPRKTESGLMYCPQCEATYSRGGWCRVSRAGKNDTSRMYGGYLGTIPDDQCPMCGNKEKKSGKEG